MRLRDFLLLVFVCVTWGFNNVLSRTVVGVWHVPPLFFATLRFALVLAVTFPWLWPIPRPVWRIATVGALMGGGTFALLFVGLQTATPSLAAIVVQAGVPLTTLLSVLVLHEWIHWRRGAGIALTLAGVLIVIWRPGFALSVGVLFVLGSTVSGSVGAIMMKQMEDIAPLRFQAWVGLTGFALLAPASALLERGQWQAATTIGWPFVGAVLFTALVVSVCAHSFYYWLIARYEANLLSPLTLMTPLATIGLSVCLLGDRLDARMIVGAVLALAGVLVIALRTRTTSIVVAQEERG